MTQANWTLEEALELCRAIQELPSEKYHCHPALTGGLLYKDGPRKDCDIIIYQRGAVKNECEEIDWGNLLQALEGIGLKMIRYHGRVIKFSYKGKIVDIIDPMETGEYPEGDEG